jgi:hypothetical protein
MSAPARKRFRVTVIEWLSHDAVIEASDAAAAEAEARRLWATNDEHEPDFAEAAPCKFIARFRIPKSRDMQYDHVN